MLFKGSGSRVENPLIMKETEQRKLTWKDKFKRDLMRENFDGVERARVNKILDLKEEEEKRAAAKVLSKLFEKKTIYLEDNEQENVQHGHYSAFIPLAHQEHFNDELYSTFPYIEQLTEKEQKQAKANIYNEISECLRGNVESNTVEIAWRGCLKKFMCDLDTLTAIEIYVELLKKGTVILKELHQKYGNGCAQDVFFHRVCQSAKYFKESSRINKNLQSSIEVGDQISEVTLPKSSKYLFCSICLLYDCNQHNVDDTAAEFNFQYQAKKNILEEGFHLNNILQLIKFQKEMTTEKSNTQILRNREIELESEEGEMDLSPECSIYCSDSCYLRMTKETMTQKSSTRRPIISLIHRSLIHMAIDIFSYEPCLISLWIGKDSSTSKIVPGQPSHRGITCESIFFYFIEEYDVSTRIQNQLYKSEVDYLMNESSRPKNESQVNVMPPSKKKKQKPKFDHENNENFKIGCCFHYFIGQEAFDINCENCSCKKRGFCLPECQCPDTCQIMKKGCSCKGKEDCRSKKCECFTNMEECIPGICHGCFDTKNIKNKKNSCRNSMILRRDTHYIRIGDSNVCGLGAFAGEDINKDDLVIIYSGEVIPHQIDYMREGLRQDDTFYNFGNNEENSGSIDARYIGNKARFINHAQDGEQNLDASTVFTEGKRFTALFAKKNIKKGEELFFNYDLTGDIAKNFAGKYPFIKPKRKQGSTGQ